MCRWRFAATMPGLRTKQAVIKYFETQGNTLQGFRDLFTESCDYPDFAHLVQRAVEKENAIRGLLCVAAEKA